MIRKLLSLLRPASADPGLIAGHARSSHWPAVRRAFLAAHPHCAVCGTGDDVEAHHVRPFHQFPSLELDPENLIALCRAHHLLFGHLMAWARINPRVRADAAEWRKRIAASKVA